ncbi:asparagine--tRNA ligase [Candidatus Mycoplasma mahonii]|uniref:asparagine--tRNA ligase n=1 Tax=Candidatus Mycoplasma mahonii TaxID=3004105 RepID=UPI0026F0A00E|nr:asparagine--tRNA ligase [Candidatus Mycoplasma mahonii]WKX02482.1 asparagine--tRNA ligase [Candidatus Mycoplasma mahonii]
MSIKKIFENKKEESTSIKGWVISNRGNNNIRFLIVNDGSTFENIQVVLKEHEAITFGKVRIGSSVSIEGQIKLTPDVKQSLEVISVKSTILKIADEDYPLQKQGISKDVLREIPHVRHRTNLFRAVMRVRSTLAQEIHKFFADENFLLMSSPIITSNDGEGAGEAFIVDDESKGLFFNRRATLGVTGQLHAEAYAQGFGKVYTFAPTFRAELSNTKRHAAEFWMLEPEVAFYDLSKIIKLSDKMLKKVIKGTIKKLPKEFEFLNKLVDKTLLEKLDKVLQRNITILDYKDAIKEIGKVKGQFNNKDIKFGMDLNTEHEKYLADTFVGGLVAVINYPKEIKSFYMHQNDDGVSVAAFDVLAPGIGELIGGSQREMNLNKLETKLDELKMEKEDLQWYLDLRRFGGSMSAGFGLGFERLVMYVTGLDNIRDSIPFPRTPKNLRM